MLKDFFAALIAVDDCTRLGHLLKDGDKFIPETDAEYHARFMLREICKHYFDDNYSAFITADKIKQLLDEKQEIYDPNKLERAATFIRNKLRPAQIITADWIVWFIRRFR